MQLIQYSGKCHDYIFVSMSTWSGLQVGDTVDCNEGLRVLAVCCQDDGMCPMITWCLIGRGPETGLVGRGSPEVHSKPSREAH